MKLDKRYILVTFPVTVVLIAVGWLMAPHLFTLASDFLWVSFSYLNLADVFVPFGLTALLFGLCAPMAAVLLWAYSRSRSAQFSFVGFLICLLVSLASAWLGMLVRVFILRVNLMTFDIGMAYEYDVWIRALRVPEWGIGSVLLICGGCTFIFLALGSGQNSKVNGGGRL